MGEDIDRYRDLAIFVKVVDLGGFTAAARATAVSTSQASRSVARLEDRLGVQLLTRTTRRLSVTQAGRALHERASVLLADLAEAESAVRDREGAVLGTVRVTAPVGFGVRFLSPLVARFATQHPGVRFDLLLDDRRVDIVAEGFDIAVRAGPLADSTLVARRVGSTHVFTVASPAWLERWGTPEEPAQLSGRDGLFHASGAGTWRYVKGAREVTVRLVPRVVSNNIDGLIAAAVAGIGVARLPDAVCAEEIVAGRLVRFLREWEDEFAISIVYPPGRHLSPRVRRFVDFLHENLKEGNWLVG